MHLKRESVAAEQARILVVDDERSQRDSICDILEQEGFAVCACATGDEAEVAMGQERFAVAVVDLRLQDTDGTLLTSRLLAVDPDLRVIINTAYGSFESARDAVNIGAFGFVEKAGDPVEFVRRVHAAVNDRLARYASSLERAVAERTRELEQSNESLRLEIDTRERLDRERQQSEERYRRLIETAPVCIKELDRDATVLTINGSGLRILGMERAEVVGNCYYDFIGGHNRELVESRLREAFDGAGSVFDFSVADEDGERFYGARFTPIRDQHGAITRVLSVTDERTDRVQAERRRGELLEQLRHSQKLEAVGTLAAGVAHDFNNMLTVILGYTEVLSHLNVESEQTGSALAGIAAAGHQALDVTRALLTFSGKSSGEGHQVMDLNATVLDAVKLLRHMMPTSIEVEAHTLAVGSVAIQGDVGQLNQVLVNLAVNARDAMPSGGTLSIEVAVDGADGANDAERAVLTIRDSGHGMSEEVRARVFEPFYTTKPRGQGTGLGLALVHGIVVEHGASIDVVSSDGAGTAIQIQFPICTGSLDEAAEVEAPSRSKGQGELVLVVEDDEAVRQLLRGVLESAGYRVVEAVDGLDGLESFENHVDEIALAVLDEDMPRMRGSECLARLRARRTDLRAVLMSGLRQAEEALSDEEDLVFLRKPFKLEHFLDHVADVIGAPA